MLVGCRTFAGGNTTGDLAMRQHPHASPASPGTQIRPRIRNGIVPASEIPMPPGQRHGRTTRQTRPNARDGSAGDRPSPAAGCTVRQSSRRGWSGVPETAHRPSGETYADLSCSSRPPALQVRWHTANEAYAFTDRDQSRGLPRSGWARWNHRSQVRLNVAEPNAR